MERKEYNGWTNYETWAVNLWIDNSESAFNEWHERARERWTEGVEPFDWETTTGANWPDQRERAISRLASDIQEQHEQDASDMLDASCGVFADLLNAALSEVNWREIAEHMIDAVQEADAQK